MNTNEDIYKILGSSNHALQERADYDFYTTPTIAVSKLLEELKKLNITLPKSIIEPSVGIGNIAKPLIENGHKLYCFDIVDRGFPNTNVVDWLSVKTSPEEEIAIIANFPFKKIQEHTEHSLSLLNKGEYLISLAKIQFLETKSRKELFIKEPPKYVLVFSERIKCLANGEDDKTSSAICFCWYIFEKGFKGLPQIDWI